LTYWQAINQARALARRQPGEPIDESRPVTVSGALDGYEADLIARGGSPYNAQHPRIHLLGSILTKPVCRNGADVACVSKVVADYQGSILSSGCGNRRCSICHRRPPSSHSARTSRDTP
jgi:hypothetical protein